MFYPKLFLVSLSLFLIACKPNNENNNNNNQETTEQPTQNNPTTEQPKLQDATWITELKTKQNCQTQDLKSLIENKTCTAKACEGNWDDLPDNDMIASVDMCASFQGLVQLDQWYLVSITTVLAQGGQTNLYVLGKGGKEIKQSLNIAGGSLSSGGSFVSMTQIEASTKTKVDAQGDLIITEETKEENIETSKISKTKKEIRYRFDVSSGTFKKS